MATPGSAGTHHRSVFHTRLDHRGHRFEDVSRLLSLLSTTFQDSDLTAALSELATAEPLQVPTEPWELIQVGNCGSPIETERGWLVLTHGVVPCAATASARCCWTSLRPFHAPASHGAAGATHQDGTGAGR